MKYLSLILLSVLFFSCEREEGTEHKTLHEVAFSLPPQTRGNEVLQFSEGDAVGVYVLDKTSAPSATLKAIGNYADNKKFVWNTTKSSFVAEGKENYIFNSPDKRLEFYVYYPYKTQVTDATNLLHVIAGTNKQDDFLLGVNNDYSGSKNIPVTFTHLLSKVDVRYTSTENRDAAQMSVSTYTDLKINLATGMATTVTSKRVALPLDRNILPDCASFTGVVAPQVWRAGEQFAVLSYGGGTAYPFSFSKDRTFSSNTSNEVYFMPKAPVYDFTISPNLINALGLDNKSYPFSLLSEKSDAINGVKLPNTTIAIGHSLDSKPDWVTLQNNSLTVTENRSVSPRTGTVIFKQDESNNLASLTVQQAAGTVTNEYVFTLSDHSSSGSWTGVPSAGSAKSYSVVSTKQILINGVPDSSVAQGYIASSSVDWISISDATLTVASNPVTSPRGGVVTFTQNESGKTIKITVTQLKKSSVDIN